ncbi:C2H2-type domain-containing protein [Plasmodiophora brassicae]|uniref:C2H2-type domain-containing protein n=1 Tax=Plasmodiophora brassicae TaxID=37360 RepID=A0A0G4IQ94_PLABS|nr:hypothetical protein PBRA_000725 [Plasmodiophora brassicae]SPQ97691.1 unnamed protein product [Plasmodiophora brassicae]
MSEYCHSCDRRFVHYEALQAHLRNSSSHYYCNDCNRDFPHYRALEQHLQMSAAHRPRPTHHCPFNDWSGFSQNDLNGHLANEHNYCFGCQRAFGAPRSLQQHLLSEKHSPKTVKCPLCSSLFSSLSAVAGHVESGGCPRGKRFNRTAVSNAIRSWERSVGAQNTYTVPLLTYNDTVDDIDVRDCYNAYYNCFFCPLCDKETRTAGQLQAHLDSSAHAPNAYRCPACSGQFVSLSSLLKHLELSACRDKQGRHLHKLVSGMNRLTL